MAFLFLTFSSYCWLVKFFTLNFTRCAYIIILFFLFNLLVSDTCNLTQVMKRFSKEIIILFYHYLIAWPTYLYAIFNFKLFFFRIWCTHFYELTIQVGYMKWKRIVVKVNWEEILVFTFYGKIFFIIWRIDMKTNRTVIKFINLSITLQRIYWNL